VALMAQLLLIRHAETDLAGTFCGHSDPPLNDRGRAQIPGLLGELEGHRIQRLYTSDLQRARQTAEAIAVRFEIEYEARAGLREIFFGSWEGLRWAEIEQREPEAARLWMERYPDSEFPSGETLGDFRMRVHREVDAIVNGGGNSPIAVVTHAGVMRTVLTDYAGLSREEAWKQTKKYAGVICVEVAGAAW